jgi:hypothetical protein
MRSPRFFAQSPAWRRGVGNLGQTPQKPKWMRWRTRWPSRPLAPSVRISSHMWDTAIPFNNLLKKLARPRGVEPLTRIRRRWVKRVSSARTSILTRRAAPIEREHGSLLRRGLTEPGSSKPEKSSGLRGERPDTKIASRGCHMVAGDSRNVKTIDS